MIHFSPPGAMLAAALVGGGPATRDRVRTALLKAGMACPVEAGSIEQLAGDGTVDVADAVVLAPGPTRAEVFDTFAAACSTFPDSPIVGIWPDGQRREDRRALRTGIAALLLESQIETGLAAAVRAACAGLVCVPRAACEYATESLSNREKQVLGMLIMGFSNAEIGRRLYLAESTVKSHVSSAYTKIGAHSRKDAAALILDPDGGLGTGILAISSGRPTRPRG